jgi:ribulose-phosphate 3-epimerase
VTVRIAPSIVSADFAHLEGAVRAVERGGADLIHVDVMDGRYVPQITIGAMIVETLRRLTTLPLDVHLMVAQPERHVEAFARAGAASIAFHPEATDHPHRVLTEIRRLGPQAGLALNPGTPPEACAWVADALDFVLIMSVNPGYSGQAFIPSVLPKIARVRALVAGGSMWVGIDGGITPATAAAAAAAGADTLVAATAIFGAADGIEAATRRLRAAAGA